MSFISNHIRGCVDMVIPQDGAKVIIFCQTAKFILPLATKEVSRQVLVWHID